MPELIVRKWDGPYSFMIFREGGLYKARRGDNGSIQFQDPQLHEVLNDVWNALTPNRAWKERVVFKGNFTVSDSIKPPSYVTIIIDGKLTLENGANSLVIEIDGVHDVDIYNGIIDGNRDNQTAWTIPPVRTRNAYNIRISGLKVVNGRYDGICIHSGSQKVWIESCETYNCGYSGICVKRDATDVLIDKCISHDNDADGAAGTGYGITVEGFDTDYPSRVKIRGCICYDNAATGIHIEDHLTNYSIENCISHSNGDHGVWVATGSDYGVISDLETYNNNKHGLFIYGCEGVTIKNVVAYNNGQESPGSYDGVLIQGRDSADITENVVLSNVVALDNQASPTQRHGINISAPYCANVAISNVVARGNLQYGVNQGNGVTKVSISGGIIFENGRHGIVVVGNGDACISGLYIRDNSQESNQAYSGIFINNAIRVTVIGCVIWGSSQKYGIEEAGTSNSNVFIGNMLWGNGVGALSVVGASTLYRTATDNDPLNLV
ncbi:MAG: hypothetical protein DRO40_11310 [Thermoprotei archaeon]|nr:MAG: hypothetical protein DRO40_11310 [Thermoprotei archaeon]